MSDKESGSTTNPNTPRLPEGSFQEEVPLEVPHEVEVDSSMKTTSTSSHGSDHDIHPTWPASFDLTDVPAMATWGPPGQPLHDSSLGNVGFNLHWHRRSQVAFFTLSICLSNRRKDNRVRGKRPVVYIYIHPERIQELSVDINPTTQPLAVKSVLLNFVLNKPPALVTPMTIDDNDAIAKDLMNSCQWLVSQTSFQLHVDISGKRLKKGQLHQLCLAASGSGLSSSERHARTDTLYHGEGGRVIEGATLESLPRYSEPVAQEPGVIPSGSKGKKCRHSESSNLEAFNLDSTGPLGSKAMLALLAYSFATFKEQLKQELRQELKQDFEDSLAAHKQDVAEKLQQTEMRVENVIRSEFGDHWDKMEDAMMDRVHEEVAEAQDNIMREITDQPLTATLTFTHHPWY